MPPSITPYQQAAEAIYEPQKQAETIAAQTTRDVTKNTLEAEKGQVGTNYQDAINQLTSAVQDQTSQINQLYSQRLGGNFSGLQGNDLGGMFSKANQQQGIIEQTRTNKLNEIAAGQTNADISYGSFVAALAPKYQSLETQYAQDAYGSAVKDYNDQQYKKQQLALSYARLGGSSSNAQASQYKATGKGTNGSTSGGYSFTGPNNQPVSLATYASNSGKSVNDILEILQNGSSYDQAIYRQVKANGLASSPQDIINTIAAEDTKNYYGFR